jgi:hypothetical protein
MAVAAALISMVRGGQFDHDGRSVTRATRSTISFGKIKIGRIQLQPGQLPVLRRKAALAGTKGPDAEDISP